MCGRHGLATLSLQTTGIRYSMLQAVTELLGACSYSYMHTGQRIGFVVHIEQLKKQYLFKYIRAFTMAIQKQLLKILPPLMLAFGCVNASASDHAVGGTLNPFGVGAFYTYKFSDSFHLRSTLVGASIDDGDVEFSDIDYEGDGDSSAVGLLVDWYPMSEGWKRNIFISTGLYYYDVEFDGEAEAKLGSQLEIGNVSVDANQLNFLDLKVETQEVTPYLGVGWGNKPRGEKGFAFVTELGLTYLDTPDVSLAIGDPDGRVSAADLEAERKSIEDDLDGVSGFLSVGVSYHF